MIENNIFSVRATNSTSISNRKANEKEYKKSIKLLHKLDEKFAKLNDEKDPDKVNRNIIKSRGKELLSKIDSLEKKLNIVGADKINPNRFFVD